MNNSFFKEEVECWGRKFEIDVSLTCYEGEKVLDSQIRTFQNIKGKLNELYDICKIKIYEYVKIDELRELFPNNEIPENIFKFIIPKAIIVTRHTMSIVLAFFFILSMTEKTICVSLLRIMNFIRLVQKILFCNHT